MRDDRLAVRILMLALCALCCTSCGPRMRNQPSIKPYERQMPLMPRGAVPIAGAMGSLTVREARLAASPLPASRVNLQNGRIYYGYYCLMCHGTNGKGDGPVGTSYVPKPADLTSRAIAVMPDGQLYERMLTGIGHDPVLVETVPPAHRWPIVMYVKRLGRD